MKAKISIYILLLFSFQTCLYSQVEDYSSLQVMDYSNARDYEIADVTVSGVEFLQPQVLISISGLQVGDKITVPGERTTKVVQKFWDQGLFSDVKLTAVKIEKGKIWLDIYLKEQPRLSRLELEGLKKGESQDLIEKINLRNGSQITADVLNNTERIIKEHFIDKGFYNTEIQIKQTPDTTRGNSVRMTVYVRKNERVKIEDIHFVGNKVFSETRLRRVMKNTKKIDINIFKPSKYIKNDFKEDKEKLLTFYNKNGYRDAKLRKDSVIILNDKRIMLYIFLEEGEKYFFRDIKWIGNTVYPAEVLNAYLGIKRGDVFD